MTEGEQRMNRAMLRARSRPRHRRLIAGIAIAGLAVGSAATLGPATGNASSHREAPITAADPKIDTTDVYAFMSPDDPDDVTFVANWLPFEEPNGGPNFYSFATDAQYDIDIDNNGDGRADVVYRWEFYDHYRSGSTFLYNTGPVTSLHDATLNYYQTYDLYRLQRTSSGWRRSTLLEDAIVAPSNVGPTSMPNYAALRQQAIRHLPGDGRTFAGQTEDPFFLDLRVFDLLYGPQPSPNCFATHSCKMTETSHDTLAGYNVQTIVLQVDAASVALKHDAKRNPVIGIWSVTSRRGAQVLSRTNGSGERRSFGPYRQVSRLGNPLVNEVVIPLKDKDRFNATTPSHDVRFLPYVVKPEVPQLIQAIYGVPAPATPRGDLVEVFLTGLCAACGPIHADLNSQLLNKDVAASRFRPSEELRLNMAVPITAHPNRLGVVGGDLQGFPNGRRLGDDVVDIALDAMEGIYSATDATSLGDGVNANDHAFSNQFPYVALPDATSVNEH
jgi:Domain of unknown function (DUF4331)